MKLNSLFYTSHSTAAYLEIFHGGDTSKFSKHIYLGSSATEYIYIYIFFMGPMGEEGGRNPYWRIILEKSFKSNNE